MLAAGAKACACAARRAAASPVCDISGELPIAELTHQAGVWHTGHAGDAYGAMLSLTILPALLQSIIEGKIDTTFLISHRMGLEDAPKGYKMFHDNQNEVS